MGYLRLIIQPMSAPAVQAEERPSGDLLDMAKMTPMSPNNILRDQIVPALEKADIAWHGYHAFRRGLATNLRALNVDGHHPFFRFNRMKSGADERT